MSSILCCTVFGVCEFYKPALRLGFLISASAIRLVTKVLVNRSKVNKPHKMENLFSSSVVYSAVAANENAMNTKKLANSIILLFSFAIKIVALVSSWVLV
ncbi:hypothetical protein D3C80_1529090 [compost metagenome]